MPDKAVVIRTIVLVVALINNALALFGKSPLPIESEDVESLVTLLFTLGASLWAWWKNNSFTFAAREGDKTMRRYRLLFRSK